MATHTFQPVSASNDLWSRWRKAHPAGVSVSGTILKVTDFGLFIDLGEGLRGFIDPVDVPEEPLAEGAEGAFIVLGYIERNQQVRLAFDRDQWPGLNFPASPAE